VLARVVGAVLAAAVIGLLCAPLWPRFLEARLFGGIDPLVQRFWLDNVSEARSALRIARDEPDMFVSVLGPLLVAAGLAIRAFWPAKGNTLTLEVYVRLIVLVLFAASVAITFWAFRGAAAATALGAVIAGAALGALSRNAPAGRLGGALLVGVLAASPALWGMLSAPLAKRPAQSLTQMVPCVTRDAMRDLSALPPGLVLSTIDLGPFILEATPHAVLAAPYHRHQAGLKAAIAGTLAPPREAMALIRARKVRYVALCTAGPEADGARYDSPHGLAARLLRGEAITGLTPVSASGPLRIWSVSSPAAP
jgi:hypothetical protein